MAKLFDLARMNTLTSGTGPVTLNAAVSGCLTWANAGVQDGDWVDYAINEGAATEQGRGQYSSSGPSLARTFIFASTAGAGTPITLTGTGAAQVYITPSAQTMNEWDAVLQATAGGL